MPILKFGQVDRDIPVVNSKVKIMAIKSGILSNEAIKKKEMEFE